MLLLLPLILLGLGELFVLMLLELLGLGIVLELELVVLHVWQVVEQSV